MLFDLGYIVVASGYRLSVNHRFVLCLLPFKGFRSKIFITEFTELSFWTNATNTKTHGLFLKAGKHRMSSFTQKVVHFPGILKPWLLLLFSFCDCCNLRSSAPRFSLHNLLIWTSGQNFTNKKHTVYYWRPGKHTISSSTQQFVHFSGTFKPWLLMLIFVKSLWKWIWLWTLKYGRGTHH